MKKILKGRILKGEGLGKQIGYPTANLDKRYFKRYPISDGVYACRIKLNTQNSTLKTKEDYLLKGIAIIGVRWVKTKKSKVEIYILDFNKNIYNWHIKAEIIKKIRPLKIYKSNEELVKQIEKDISKTREILTPTISTLVRGRSKRGS